MQIKRIFTFFSFELQARIYFRLIVSGRILKFSVLGTIFFNPTHLPNVLGYLIKIYITLNTLSTGKCFTEFFLSIYKEMVIFVLPKRTNRKKSKLMTKRSLLQLQFAR